MATFGSPPSRDVVTIDLSSHSSHLPLGMLLAPGSGGPSAAPASSPTSSNVTLVAGWEHGASSSGGGGRHLGPIQRSGLVRLGDRLVRINGRDVTGWSFREVMDALKELVSSSNAAPTSAGTSTSGGRRKRLKTLGFAPAGTAEWSRGTYQTKEISESTFFGLFGNFQHPSSEEQPAPVVHSKTKYSFASFIGGWRVANGPACDTVAEMGNESVQPRQHSDNSAELERQLNKQPSISYDEDQGHGLDLTVQTSPLRPSQLKEEAEGDAPTANDTSDPEDKPFVQYEIQCHMLLKDQTSFGNPQHVHRSWSVWKRYSELTLLDDQLRRDFGWQMDALDEGRGITFPSPHGIESWWYGVRNGGGVVTSLMGTSTGVSGEENGDKTEEGSGSGWGSLYGWFRTSSDSTNASKANGTAPTDTNASRNDEGTTQSLHQNCPLPVSFIERRQKELSSYWTNLMRVEDIFEFSDVRSHKFGKAMASFLEVDKVLLSKGGSVTGVTGLGSPQRLHSAFPAIVEEDETAEMLGSFRPSFREGFGLTGSHRHDDDVSVLTEATGLAFADSRSPVRDRPVVDVVPGQCASGGDGETDKQNGVVAEHPEKPIESSSVASSSAAASRRRRKARTAPRTKPAFQRQFLTP
ncbi:hypothetical protein ACHAXT_010817 [Thalassiosira profunda]